VLDKALVPIDILRDIEIDLRAEGKLGRETLKCMTALPDFQYRAALDFANRVTRYLTQQKDIGFLYKMFENMYRNPLRDQMFFKPGFSSVDIVITVLKRNQNDFTVTDPDYELVHPGGANVRVDQIWGFNVVDARNKAVFEALKSGARMLLFIDDDILAPRNALLRLLETISNQHVVVAANYTKKIEPLESVHQHKGKPIPVALKKPDDPDRIVPASSVCGMGFTLINLEYLQERLPWPWFWEFRDMNNMIVTSEDSFFTQLVHDYAMEAERPVVVDTSVSCLHVDKDWKRVYGVKDESVKYASGWFNFVESRVPPKNPLIVTAIPTRDKNTPVFCDLNKLSLLRGYRSKPIGVAGAKVDEARTALVTEALKLEADYVLFIDDDIIPPRDALVKLLALDVDVAAANYPIKDTPLLSAFMSLDENGVAKDVNLINEWADKTKPRRVTFTPGLGFTLIKTRVFHQLRKPWFQATVDWTPYGGKPDEPVGEDAWFFEALTNAGIEFILDPSIQCVHVDFEAKPPVGHAFDFTGNWDDYAAPGYARNLRVISEPWPGSLIKSKK